MVPMCVCIAGVPLRKALAARALSLLVLVASLACTSTDRAAVSDSAHPGASGTQRSARRGTFVDGDERSNWTLTTAADGSSSIEDDVRFGEDGQANRVFSFDKRGILVRATEQRSQTVQSGDRSPASMRVELIVDFAKAAPVARKMVDGVPRDVQSFEIDNIRRRADAVRAQAFR